MCLCDGVMTSTQLLSVIADTVRVIEWGNPRSVAYHVYSPQPCPHCTGPLVQQTDTFAEKQRLATSGSVQQSPTSGCRVPSYVRSVLH